MCVCSDFKRGGVRAEFGCFQNGYDIYDIIRSAHLKIHRHPSSSKGPSPNPSNPCARTLRSLCRTFKKYTYIISTKFPHPKQCATTGCSPNTVMQLKMDRHPKDPRPIHPIPVSVPCARCVEYSRNIHTLFLPSFPAQNS